MKNILKHILFFLVISTLLVACNNGENNVENNNNNTNDKVNDTQTAEGEKVTIGVMLYNYTDIQGKQIQEYGDYLEENFNVTFNYATVGSSEEDHITGLENLISSGVDAIISGYDTSLEQSINLTEQAGVYYAVALGDIKTEVTSDYFIGGLNQFGKNPEELGSYYADQAYIKGVKNIGVTTFPEFAFVDSVAIINGFKNRLEEIDTDNEITVYETESHMFSPDDVANTVTKIIADHPEVDAIFGLGSGMDFVYPAVLNSTKPDIKVLALGYNDSTESALEDESVIIAGTNNYSQIMANVFAQLYDRLNGNSYSDWQLNGYVDYPIVTSLEDNEDFKQYIIPADKSNGSVTADELKKVMKTYNDNATWEELQELTSRSLGEIKLDRIEKGN